MISEASRLGKDYRVDAELRELARKSLPIKIEKEKFEQILDLRDYLVGKIYSVIYDVSQGTPLMGYCDHCPNRRITISE